MLGYGFGGSLCLSAWLWLWWPVSPENVVDGGHASVLFMHTRHS